MREYGFNSFFSLWKKLRMASILLITSVWSSNQYWQFQTDPVEHLYILCPYVILYNYYNPLSHHGNECHAHLP